MSDLIERLGSASLEDLPALLLATKLHIEAQQAEIARLRDAIAEAVDEMRQIDDEVFVEILPRLIAALEQKP